MVKIKTREFVLIAVVSVIGIIIAIIAGCAIYTGSSGIKVKELNSADVALIKIEGTILSGSEAPGFFSQSAAMSEEIIEKIDQAKDDPNIKAVIFEINSPGGSAVGSDEIGTAIKSLKNEKPTVAWIREVGASGGYWVASATDHIVANRMSITGSIGVIASYLDFSGLLDKYDVKYQRVVSGKYKDIGTPFKELTDEEAALLQAQLDTIHDYFIQEVADNRNMKVEKVREFANGMMYLGAEAKELGFIDELGGRAEVIEYLEGKLNAKVNVIEYKNPPTLLDMFSQIVAQHGFSIGKGLNELNLETQATIKT